MRTAIRHLPHLLSLGLAAALLAACGAGSDLDEPIASEDLGTGEQALIADNGLSTNGLNRNGLNRNGLNRNGLNRNGLNLAEFSTWFNEEVATSSPVMKYLYGCGAAPGSTLTWTNPATGTSYSWAGALGIAPGWTGGTPATEVEQQIVSACLAAHTNYYGQGVDIAVEGYRADGSVIPKTANELTTYSVREAAFFGNVFDASGALYSCRDNAEWGLQYSSPRACTFDYSGSATPGTLCAPIVYVGRCSSYCTWKTSDAAYTSCSYGGKVYKPITTRIRPTDVYRCGDGICQFTERCGTGTVHDACMADCGLCPGQVAPPRDD